jgi:hypothetical protein
LEASATFKIDREYLRANFDDWLASASRWRRWQRQIAWLLFPAGIAMLLTGTSTVQVFGAAALFVSVIEMLEFYWYRSKWIGGRLTARKAQDERIEMRFDDAGVEVVGPNSQGRISWQGFKGSRNSRSGIYLQFGDGLSIYVPKASINPPSATAAILALAAGGT